MCLKSFLLLTCLLSLSFVCKCAWLFSHVQVLVTPWNVASLAPLSMKFSKQKHWSRVVISSSRGSSQPRDQTRVSCGFCIGRQILYHWTTWVEKAMAPHSSILAWKIPWTEEPGRLQSVGSLRVRHDWAASLSLFTFMHWRRKWRPTSVFLPGESQWQGSLVGCRLWGCTESDMTEVTWRWQQSHLGTPV